MGSVSEEEALALCVEPTKKSGLVSPAAAGCLNPLLLSDIALAPNWYQKVLISQTKAWNSVGAVARHKSNKVYSLCTENQQRSVSAPPPGPVYATDAHAQPPQAIPERRLHNHISRAHARAPVLYHTHIECCVTAIQILETLRVARYCHEHSGKD